ncbi:MAG: hypothetical protein WC562_03840 [Dehalococcoidia bacterium]
MKDSDTGWMEPGIQTGKPLPKQPPIQYKVGMRSIKIIGCIGITVFTIVAIVAFLAQQYVGIWICFAVILLGAILILAPGHFIFDEESVTWRNIFLTRRIYWRDIKKIEYGQGGDLLLHTDKKRLNVFPPSFWSGPDKENALAFFLRKLQECEATPYPGGGSPSNLNKNVKDFMSKQEPAVVKPAFITSQPSDNLKVGLRTTKIYTLLGIVISAGGAIGSFLAHENSLAYFLVAFSVLCVINLIWRVNHFTFNDESVTCSSMLATYRIYWHEVKNITFDKDGTLSLYGDNKVLLVPSVLKWSGPQKNDAHDLFQKKIKESGLQPEQGNRSGFKFNRNVRVSRKSL